MSRSGKLAPEVNRALFVKNLNFQVTPEELFDLFGRFGAIRQIRQGIANNTKGTAFVVFEDVMDAKSACDKLNGFNFQNRYLVVLYHQPEKMVKAQADLAERQETASGEDLLQGSGAVKPDQAPYEGMKRKDSGLSVGSASSVEDTLAPKTRDFAVKEANTTTNATMNTPAKTAGTAVATKDGKNNGSVWRRVRITVSKLGGKA
ncbi:hypothetical protein KC332_g18217 [Hortaea werneckii]|nr:hypothetical protein KC358_g18360 [Hortaea werneckii]KAI6907041.1 hypothetical protein KC348_g14399 [Hortaea werneckii]KAI6918178.1 hypothetical protein KC341_g18049 [Hortaea werneckii]KAI6955137.1 hypothetical protein KC321_g15940 [Hortaea werneckii]KAI7006107.1 hypothetical protein KC362_g18320 [Hortaea werneckii]